MKIIHLVLLFLTLILVLLIIIAFTEQPVAMTVAHSSIAGMINATDATERIEHIAIYAFWLHGMTLGLALSLIAMSVKKVNRNWQFWLPFAGAGVILMATWSMVFYCHQDFLETAETDYFMGFPIATAWMIYGIWLSELLLCAIYVFGFRKFIFSERDARHYRQLLDGVKP